MAVTDHSVFVFDTQAWDSLRVSWSTGTSPFDVERADDDGAGSPDLATTDLVVEDTSSQTFDDSDLSPNTRYHYRVRDSGDSWSDWENHVTPIKVPANFASQFTATLNARLLTWTNDNEEGDLRQEGLTVEHWDGSTWNVVTTGYDSSEQSYRLALASGQPVRVRIKYDVEDDYTDDLRSKVETFIGVAGTPKTVSDVFIGAPDKKSVTEIWQGTPEGKKLAFLATLLPPGSPSATTLDYDSIEVSFSPDVDSIGDEQYAVYYRQGLSLGNDPEGNSDGVVRVSSSPAQIDGVVDDEEIFAVVSSERGSFGSAPSAEVSTITDPAPLTGSPSWFGWESDGGDVRLQLDGTGVPDAESFEVYASQSDMAGDPLGNGSLVGTPDAASIVNTWWYHTTPSTGETWYYQIRGKKVGDNGTVVYSSFNEQKSVEVTDEVPGTPTNVSATADSSVPEVTVSWDPGSPDTADTYRAQRRERSIGASTWSSWGTFAGNTTTAPDTDLVDSGVLEGSEYQYRVRAENTGGDSAYSTASNTAQVEETGPSAPPSNLVAMDNSSCGSGCSTVLEVGLAWDNGDTSAGTRIYRDSVEIDTVAAGVDSYTDTSPGTGTVDYEVRHFKDGEESAGSTAQVTVQEPCTPPSAPPILVETVDSSTLEISLSTSQPDVAKWEVYRENTTDLVGSFTDPNGSVIDDNRTEGVEYCYDMIAIDFDDCESDPATDCGTPTTVAPQNLAGTLTCTGDPATPDHIDLTWDLGTHTDKDMTLQRSTDDATWTTIANPAAGTTSHTDNSPPQSGTAYYRIGFDGHSDWEKTSIFLTCPS